MVTFTSQKRLEKDFELELSTIFVFLIRTVFDEFCVSMQLQTLTRKLTQLWYEKRVVSVMVSHQGSHRSGKSGNSGKILKTFSSQGNQGKTGGFQPKSGKKF